MNSMQINEDASTLTAKHFGLGKVSLDDRLVEDLGADPLDMLELVMSLEEKFNIEIPDIEIDTLYTVNDVCNAVVSKMKATAG